MPGVSIFATINHLLNQLINTYILSPRLNPVRGKQRSWHTSFSLSTSIMLLHARSFRVDSFNFAFFEYVPNLVDVRSFRASLQITFKLHNKNLLSMFILTIRIGINKLTTLMPS